MVTTTQRYPFEKVLNFYNLVGLNLLIYPFDKADLLIRNFVFDIIKDFETNVHHQCWIWIQTSMEHCEIIP